MDIGSAPIESFVSLSSLDLFHGSFSRILAPHVLSCSLSVACFGEHLLTLVGSWSSPVHCLFSAFLYRCLALAQTSIPARLRRNRECLAISHSLLLLHHRSSGLLNASSKAPFLLSTFFLSSESYSPIISPDILQAAQF